MHDRKGGQIAICVAKFLTPGLTGLRVEFVQCISGDSYRKISSILWWFTGREGMQGLQVCIQVSPPPVCKKVQTYLIIFSGSNSGLASLCLYIIILS